MIPLSLLLSQSLAESWVDGSAAFDDPPLPDRFLEGSVSYFGLVKAFRASELGVFECDPHPRTPGVRGKQTKCIAGRYRALYT